MVDWDRVLFYAFAFITTQSVLLAAGRTKLVILDVVLVVVLFPLALLWKRTRGRRRD